MCSLSCEELHHSKPRVMNTHMPTPWVVVVLSCRHQHGHTSLCCCQLGEDGQAEWVWSPSPRNQSCSSSPSVLYCIPLKSKYSMFLAHGESQRRRYSAEVLNGGTFLYCDLGLLSVSVAIKQLLFKRYIKSSQSAIHTARRDIHPVCVAEQCRTELLSSLSNSPVWVTCWYVGMELHAGQFALPLAQLPCRHTLCRSCTSPVLAKSVFCVVYFFYLLFSAEADGMQSHPNR